MVTFVIRGNQLIQDPSIGTNSSKGEATLHWGREVFAADRMIEITAINPISNGTELNGGSRITGIRVFDASGKLIEEYVPMNPGQTADIQGDISGVGDGYARINASTLKPTMTNQWLGPVLITNGSNTFGTYPMVFKVGNNAYDIMATQGLPVPCFGPDVRLRKSDGTLVAVRDLTVGENILTQDGAAKTLWIGRRHVECTGPKDRPIEVDGELFSPQHRILWRDAWAKARHLAEIGMGQMRTDIAEIDYYHILLSRHSVILTERNCVESLLIGERHQGLWGNAIPVGLMHNSTVLHLPEWRRHQVLAHSRRAA